MSLVKTSVVAMMLGTSIIYASPITHTFTQTASGTIGATPFTNATLAITVVGDTSSVVFNGTSSVNYAAPFAAGTAVRS